MSTDRAKSFVTRRHALRMFGLTAAGLALTACAQPASQPAPTTAPAKPTTAPAAGAATSQPQTAPAAKNFSGQTIRMGVVANYKGDAIEQTLPEFEKATGIKVQLDKLPHNNLADKLAVSLASGNPDYDTAMMDEPWIAGLSPYLLNLDDLVKRDNVDLKQYVPNGLTAGVYNDTRVAWPLDPNVMMLWYRKDLFEEKGVKPPTTWAEIMDAAEKLKDPAKGIAGITVTAKKDVQASVTSIVLLWNQGQEVITSDRKFGFDSPAGPKAFEDYQRIIKAGPDGVLGYGPTEQLDAFYTGKAAMVFYWASIGPNATDPAKSTVADKVGWVSIPKGMRGVWNLGIPKDSKNKDATWEWVKWLTGPEGSLLFTRYGGGHSPRYDVLNNPEFQKKYPWAPDFLKALEGSKYRPQTPSWNAIETVIVDMTTSILSGQKQPNDAIKSASEQVAPYLKA